MREFLGKVNEAIEEELDYQDEKWGSPLDHPHEVPGWTCLMRKYLDQADAAWCSNEEGWEGRIGEAMRKATALGIQCMRQHGVPYRSTEEPKESK